MFVASIIQNISSFTFANKRNFLGKFLQHPITDLNHTTPVITDETHNKVRLF